MKTLLHCVILAALPVEAAERRVVAERYWHTFSAGHPVLLTVKPGDRIVTKTVDSAGFDWTGVRRTLTHGNPLTGPFFVEDAQAGDALEVRIDRIRLNRTTGYSGYHVGLKDMPPVEKPGADVVYEGYDYLFPWTIDLKRGAVRTGRLEFGAQPMLGCIGVAPKNDYSPRSGPAGYWGGNLDYNLIRQGATVLLPVFHPGGLLFFGDGHALQGDGEAVGSGVETSLDVQVTVGLRKSQSLTGPRVETAEWIVSVGGKEGGTLNDTLEIATRDMLRWLMDEHGFSAQEAHLLIGVRARYDLITLGGSVGLRIVPRACLDPNHRALPGNQAGPHRRTLRSSGSETTANSDRRRGTSSMNTHPLTKENKFKPRQSGNSETMFKPGNPHRWAAGVSGNPSGKSRRRARFEEEFNEALITEGSPEEAAKLLWEAARAKEPWAIQSIRQRFAPQTQSLRLVHEVNDDGIEYSKLTDEQLDQLDAIFEQAGIQPHEIEGGEGPAKAA